ncbi:TPA: hypothetical protein N0F65_002212 [Lagenidium giganteum]|uniref:Lysosomal Pro-X carboxypeptidase n=1 Tax=Lagenidium giganteum TaxID=4803 RepID=A0AAV2YUT9_9STRA|nr:TPA: hypothetical protein N0F65_002212 [Lagenidium giganteum]
MASTEGSPLLARASRPSRWLLPRTTVLVGTAAIVLFSVCSFQFLRVPTTWPTSSTATLHERATSASATGDGHRDLVSQCTELRLEQPLDHFVADGGAGSFQQRYYVCDQFFDATAAQGAVFLYAGNEADVELYVNNMGLMWENAQAFNALLVFAEHRYFGQSMPFPPEELDDHMQFLSSAQALEDFARVVATVKTSYKANNVPVIAFGGSYGGMLAAWMRMKYPFVVDGAIAASAPLLAFLGETFGAPVDSEAFLRIATRGATPAGGAAEQCVPNIRRAVGEIIDRSKTAEGRQQLATWLRFCDPDVLATKDSVMGIVNAVAMANYPYPSTYMTGGQGPPLPAFPVRAACAFLEPEFASNDAKGLLTAFRKSVGVLYNSSHVEPCYFPPTQPPPTNASLVDRGNLWGYLNCAELFMPFSSDGVHDMFPPHAFDLAEAEAACHAQWGVQLRPHWAITHFGGRRALRSTSNIVFSNGDLDPWSGTGVTADDVAGIDSLVALPVVGGAHHVDLFFTHELDTPGITKARETEKQHMQRWVAEYYANAALAPPSLRRS